MTIKNLLTSTTTFIIAIIFIMFSISLSNLNSKAAVDTKKFNSEIISYSIPTTVQPNSTVTFTVTVKNLGTNQWKNSTNYKLANLLGASSDISFKTVRMFLSPTVTINTGQTVTFTTTFVVPPTLGLFEMQYQMIQENAVFFGEITPVIKVLVTNDYLSLPKGSTVNHFLMSGQSLSEGYNATPAVSKTPKNNVWTLENIEQTGNKLIPLIEGVTDFPDTESPLSGLGIFVTENVPDYGMILTRHGIGATAYSKLKFGTAAFNQGMTQVKNAKQEVANQNNDYKYNVPALGIVHGESDQIDGETLNYSKNLLQWWEDYNREVKLITGQTNDIVMFTDQMTTYNIYPPAANRSPGIPLQQLLAYETNPSKIILVGPKYQFDYSDQVHLTGKSSKILGEYYGKAYKKIIVDKQTYEPLKPLSIIRESNIIEVKLNSPSNTPITLDSTLVAKRANYGFEYKDSSGNTPTIKNVNVTGPDTLEIELSSVPIGINEELAYGLKGVDGLGGGASNPNTPGGNVRDSDTTKGESNTNLYNWLVLFQKPVEPIKTELNIGFKVNLSGTYNISTNLMNTGLSTLNLIPNSSTFSNSIDKTKIVDYVKIEFIPSSRKALPTIKVDGLLLSDGNIVNPITGDSKLLVNELAKIEKYKVVLRHRNHIPIAAVDLLDVNSPPTEYDFTNPLNVKGGFLKNITGTVYGLYEGNSASDDKLNSKDRIQLRTAVDTLNIYSDLDLNLDGRINTNDRVISRLIKDLTANL